MIAFIRGSIQHKNPAFIYVETHGVGYHLHISLNTYSKIEKLDEVMIYTYLHVKEDSQTLYGFYDEDEKRVFLLLLSVSGIGPNTARVILSYMSAGEVKQAILREDVASFNKVKGVGPKTAKRLILDLKDKVLKGGDTVDLENNNARNSASEEALAALMALGFQKNSVEKVLLGAYAELGTECQAEDLIKFVLKKLS